MKHKMELTSHFWISIIQAWDDQPFSAKMLNVQLTACTSIKQLGETWNETNPLFLNFNYQLIIMSWQTTNLTQTCS